MFHWITFRWWAEGLFGRGGGKNPRSLDLHSCDGRTTRPSHPVPLSPVLLTQRHGQEVQDRRREDAEREDVGRPRPGTRHPSVRPRRPLSFPFVPSVCFSLWLLPILVEPLYFLSHAVFLHDYSGLPTAGPYGFPGTICIPRCR